MSKRQRIFCIFHLCFAFSLLLWIVGYPFMGQHAKIKEAKIQYAFVKGKMGPDAALNAKLFSDLPLVKREKIDRDLQQLHAIEETPFTEKVGQTIHLFLFDIPYFELFWLLFSLVIPILLLRERDGAHLAVWILPLITFAYIIDSPIHIKHSPSSDEALFPSETLIFSRYVREAPDSNWSKQKEQLQTGWYRYLIEEWAHQTPASDPKLLAHQIRIGTHAFETERLLQKTISPEAFASPLSPQPESRLWHFLYLFWNILFATTVNRQRCQRNSRGLLGV